MCALLPPSCGYLEFNLLLIIKSTTMVNNPISPDHGQENEQAQVLEFTTRKVLKRKPLRQWGFEEAGVNRGDTMALESNLRAIQQGHLVDETYNADEEIRRKNTAHKDVTQKESQQTNLEKDRNHISEVIIADKEKEIKTTNLGIQEKMIQIAEGTIQSGYNGARFWLYSSLCIIISNFLIFFYASAINASFFRNMQQMVEGENLEDLSLSLNSPFDVNGLFKLGPHLPFIYLGAFIFFGFGLLPHLFHSEESKSKTIKVALAVIICLIVDALLAYKIDSGIHELKTMMGVADKGWIWYKSVNFYLVLTFGFGTYLLWGFLYEAAIKENEKKNVTAKGEIEINGLKAKIRNLENEIIAEKEKIKELEKQISALTLEIERLKKQIEQAALKPEELMRNMEHFYSGWLQYLLGLNENNSKKQACEDVYKRFHASINPSLN